MKKTITLLLALLIMVLAAMPAAAAWDALSDVLNNSLQTISPPDSTETAVTPEDGMPSGSEQTTGDVYVIDLYGLLTDVQKQTLTSTAQAISERTGCGVHIGVIDDMTNYGFSSIEACAEAFYTQFGLGVGSEHTGILLLLSMAERDYDLAAYGSFAHTSFTDYGKRQLAAAFLDNFRSNDWYGGFSDYLAECEYMLDLSAQGEPVDVPAPTPPERITGIGSAVSAILGALVSFVICAIMKGRMKNVRTAANADRYVPRGGIQFHIRDDRFSHSTQVRTHIERSNSGSGSGGGGGTSVNSGGFSHSSGKF